MQCEACGKFLFEDWEIYGDTNEHLCFDCWDEMRIDAQGYDEVYGLAPHYHDMSRTGSIIGSIVFKPLEGEPDEDGWYHLEDKVWFRPDTNPDGEGMGLWRYWL